MLLSACRGKLWEGRPAAQLGPLTAISVPQSWFGDFYLVGVCVNLGLIVLQLVTAKSGLCLEVIVLCITPAVHPSCIEQCLCFSHIPGTGQRDSIPCKACRLLHLWEAFCCPSILAAAWQRLRA